MMEGGRNTSLNMRDREDNFRPMKETHLSCNTERRNAVRKSKSVGYDNAQGLWMLSEMRRGANEYTRMVGTTTLSTNYHNNRIETRTVKSDTCLSPPKRRNVDLVKVNQSVIKKSPSSICEIDKQIRLHQSISDKKSLSNHGSSVLEILSGFSISNRAPFNLSSCFSDEDESNVSSFADDDIFSLPTTVPFSVGNVSMPSELTVSQTLDVCSPQSKPEERRKLAHNVSRVSTDLIPRPPRRKNSDKEFSYGGQNKPLVPQHIECFPMDESPMKPSRQISSRKLLDSSCSSILTKVSASDLSPKIPKRHNSNKSSNSMTSHFECSGLSVDSLPQQPQRQESNISLTNAVHTSNITNQTKHSSSNPPIRKVDRSESRLQPHLPFLSRRTSITEKPKDLSTYGTSHSALS